MLVEVLHGLRIMRRQLALGNLIHPRTYQLAEDLPTGLPAHGLGDHPDRVLRFDETERHNRLPGARERTDGMHGRGPIGRDRYSGFSITMIPIWPKGASR